MGFNELYRAHPRKELKAYIDCLEKSMRVFHMRTVLLTVLVSMFLSTPASAHDFRESIEKVVGDYLFDIGYDTDVFRAGEPIQFDFTLFKKEEDFGTVALYGSDPPDFTDVRVQVSRQPQARGVRRQMTQSLAQKQAIILFSGNIHRPKFGVPDMSFVFPTSGQYELAVGFHQNGIALAKSSLAISVEEAGTAPLTGYLSVGGTLISAIVGLAIGFGLALSPFVRSRRS